MRTPYRQLQRGSRGARTLVAVLMALAATCSVAAVAVADEGDAVPSQAQVDAARAAAQHKARDAAAVQADLVLADQALQQASIAAAKAGEAYNGALYRLQQARQEARAADQRAAAADRAVAEQQRAYGNALATTYTMAPQLTTVAALMNADGPTGVLERSNTLSSAQQAMDAQYDAFRATATIATVARAQAQKARDRAADLEAQLAVARDSAVAAADAAAAEARQVAARKQRLVAELAHLQHVSVAIARQRQVALEEQAREAAAAAAKHAAEVAAQQAAQHAAEVAAQQAAQQAQQDQSDDQSGDQSDGQTDGQAAPPPVVQDPPPASGSAQDAIDFARAQLGEPYVWGASGPDAWDCSGLTMRSWEAGGISLPHYSVAQYEQSTPISPSDLRPGDLVFWGESNDPNSIYHVAMYLGDGQIIQAPRTGRDVEIVSMYYWIPPNFYARP